MDAGAMHTVFYFCMTVLSMIGFLGNWRWAAKSTSNDPPAEEDNSQSSTAAQVSAGFDQVRRLLAMCFALSALGHTVFIATFFVVVNTPSYKILWFSSSGVFILLTVLLLICAAHMLINILKPIALFDYQYKTNYCKREACRRSGPLPIRGQWVYHPCLEDIFRKLCVWPH